MSTSDKFRPILEKVDLLRLELRQLRKAGVHFKILHRFRAPGTICGPGEEVEAIFLVSRALEYHVPLSLTLRLIFDFFARHVRIPQSASQIAACFRTDPFYREHGRNALGSGTLVGHVSRSSVRVHVARIRQALVATFREADLVLDPCDILVAEKTVTNEIGYRLHATFERLHQDHPGRNLALIP